MRTSDPSLRLWGGNDGVKWKREKREEICMIKRSLITIDDLFYSRYRCAALGLPGRGVRPSGEHREVQQPPLWQEQERRLCAGGQLPAERAGPARGAARGLPLQLRDVAGTGGLLPAHPVGGASAGSVTGRGDPGRILHGWWTVGTAGNRG